MHLIGGYEDSSFQVCISETFLLKGSGFYLRYRVQLMHIYLSQDVDVSGESEHCREKFGHSWDLCCEIVKALHNDATPFHIKTLCILSHNTWKDNRGISRPIFHGFLVSQYNDLKVSFFI